MNIFQKIKALFAVKSTTEEIYKEATMPTASGKPGWKTSEFWVEAATKIGILWGAVSGLLPPKWAAIIAAAGTAVYVIARTIAKAVSDIQAARGVSTPVSETATATATVKTS